MGPEREAGGTQFLRERALDSGGRGKGPNREGGRTQGASRKYKEKSRKDSEEGRVGPKREEGGTQKEKRSGPGQKSERPEAVVFEKC